MKYCKNCSAVLGDLDAFCSECGASVDLEETNQNSQTNQYSQDNSFGDSQQSNDYENEFTQQQYENTSNNYQQPQQYNNNQPNGKDPGQLWLILSIVTLVCCCQLLSIPSLVFAILSSQSYKRGDYLDAQNKAKTAMILFFVALGVSIIWGIISFATFDYSELTDIIGTYYQ